MTPNLSLPSRILLAAFFLLAMSQAAAAQPSMEDMGTAPHRRGPFAAKPEFAVTDFGVDTNVFNAVRDPGADVVASFRPATDLWFRSGRWEAAGRTQVGANFFRRYASERSADTDNRLWAAGRAGRVMVFTTAMFLSSRDRISPEIDDRVRHLERASSVGTDVRIGARTRLRATAGRLSTQYSDNAAAGSYAEALNRSETTITAALRYSVTPLTTLVFEGSQRVSRFVFVDSRDANTVSLMPGLEFARGALVSGRGFVGYRRLDFRDQRTPDFSGVAASVDVAYTLQGATKFGLTADRNVEYSFEFDEPYFVSTGTGLNVVNQTTDRWSVLGSLSRRRLAYQALQALTTIAPRTDSLTTTRLGIGYRIAPRIRAEFSGSYQQRSSPRVDRRYAGTRVGISTFFAF